MPTLVRCLVLALLALSPLVAHARYRRPELVNVPVERLVKNLEAAAAKEPKNADIRLNLARAHAMAYAQRSDSVEVNKDAADRPWLGYEPQHVPFNVQPSDDADK